MLILHLSIVLIYGFPTSNATISAIALKREDNYSKVTQCVQNIIERYYETHNSLTFVNFRTKNMNILSHIHATGSLSILNRKPFTKMSIPNSGYLIYAQTADDFLTRFWYLRTEKMWMPYAPFLIVVQVLDVTALPDIFQELLKAHVKDVIILDGSTIESYTYDPYENNGCGKSFDKIINFGKCLTEMPPGHFRKQLEYRLQNCTLKVAITHWPPYGVDPTKSQIKVTGSDEYLFTLIAEHEQMKVDIRYVDDIADQVSAVNSDMIANGPLRWLQTNEYDVVTGGVALLLNRVAAFDYIYAHSAYDDEISIIVRQASDVPSWKILFLVFTPLVWLLLLLSFVAVVMFVICITKPKDHAFIILNLFENLIQHSCRIQKTHKTELVLIFWIIFASLITTYYSSDLFSFTTRPISDYQIDKVSDLKKYQVQPCVSTAMQQIQQVASLNALNISESIARNPGCEKMRDSLSTVSKSHPLHYYTMVPYCLYYFDRYQYFDKNGKSLLYSFRQSFTKMVYASYLAKGFPLNERFNLFSLRVREAGLTKKLWDDYEYAQKKYNNVTQQVARPQFYLPMFIIVFGWIISTICFIAEVLVKLYIKAHVLNK